MFAYWRSRGRVEGRWAAVVQSTAVVEAGRGERGMCVGGGGGNLPKDCGYLATVAIIAVLATSVSPWYPR